MEALDNATKCRSCSEQVETVIHAGCIPPEIIKRGAKIGTATIETKFKEWLARKLSGQPGRSEEQPDDEGPPRRRWKG